MGTATETPTPPPCHSVLGAPTMTTTSTNHPPVLRAGMGFDEASAAVVDYLKVHVPLGFWAVTRFDGDRQLYLEVRDDAYGLAAGGAHGWEDSFCIHMAAGRTPQIAPDAMSVPEYENAGVARQITIGAYVGIPIEHVDGELFGTLCGLDPDRQPQDLEDQAPLLALLSGLLSVVLDADLSRTESARRLERAELLAETDPLTGMLNRRGWDRFIELEEERYRRFGDPGSVIIIDLDGLKTVNDTLGHAAGDAHIARAGRALTEALRVTDLAARLGGDEFGVIAVDTSPAEAQQLLGRIGDAFDAAGVEGSSGHAAYGIVAGFPAAIKAADDAMYVEKRRRRGRPDAGSVDRRAG